MGLGGGPTAVVVGPSNPVDLVAVCTGEGECNAVAQTSEPTHATTRVMVSGQAGLNDQGAFALVEM